MIDNSHRCSYVVVEALRCHLVKLVSHDWRVNVLDQLDRELFVRRCGREKRQQLAPVEMPDVEHSPQPEEFVELLDRRVRSNLLPGIIERRRRASASLTESLEVTSCRVNRGAFALVTTLGASFWTALAPIIDGPRLLELLCKSFPLELDGEAASWQLANVDRISCSLGPTE